MLVPVKSFTDAKQRLRSVLPDHLRSALARHCAETVLRAGADLGVWVVCDDDDIDTWARQHGASVLRTTAAGLNPAITDGAAQLAASGADPVVIAHGDLPLARRLGSLLDAPPPDTTVTLVPDLGFDGTNVMVLPRSLIGRFTFRYGRGSFLAHLGEALRQGAAVRIIRDTELAHDIDTPDDLERPEMEEIRQWLRTNPDSRR